MIFWILGFSVVIAVIDQVLKCLVLEFVEPVGSISVIDSWFSLVYVENRGVAFGLFQNTAWFFSIVTAVIIVLMIFFYQKYKFKSRLVISSMILIIGGGFGNLIDRVLRGYVIDYLSVSFFPPVCNFADYCIVTGSVLLLVALVFTDALPSEKKEKSKVDGENHE